MLCGSFVHYEVDEADKQFTVERRYFHYTRLNASPLASMLSAAINTLTNRSNHYKARYNVARSKCMQRYVPHVGVRFPIPARSARSAI